MRADAGKLQTDINTCAQRLQDATLVHDHVKRWKEEARQLRRDLEKQIAEARGNEQALRRLLKDRELETVQANRLKEALIECGKEKSRFQSTLENTNMELRDAKRIQGTLTDQMGELSKSMQRTSDEQKANLSRDQLETKIREGQLISELDQLKLQNEESVRRIQQLNVQKDTLAEGLANSEIDRARQLRTLLAAQQYDPRSAIGRSMVHY